MGEAKRKKKYDKIHVGDEPFVILVLLRKDVTDEILTSTRKAVFSLKFRYKGNTK